MDLIDREHLISAICNNCTAKERCKANHEENECDDVDILIIRNEPKADAKLVIHAHWDAFGRCSHCNAYNSLRYGFCPNCGAEMNEVYETCKGCRHNIIVNGIQVCWQPFERGGDIHTVFAITDTHDRCKSYSPLIHGMTQVVNDEPTIEAEPVRHSHWRGSGENVRCSACGNHPLKDMDVDHVYYWKYKPNYCPNCGAKMDEESK